MMGNESREQNSGERKNYEWKLQEFSDLVKVKTFESFGAMPTWFVTVEWSEPRVEHDENGEPQVYTDKWIKHTASGPLDQLFLEWARQHFEYWEEKALTSLKVTKVEYMPEGLSGGQRQW